MAQRPTATTPYKNMQITVSQIYFEKTEISTAQRLTTIKVINTRRRPNISEMRGTIREEIVHPKKYAEPI